MKTIVVLLAFLMCAVAKTPDTCPKPPTSLLCNVGVKNICTNATNCVAGTLCCSDGCRKRCRDPSENNRGFEEAIPRGGTCPPNLKPPSGACASDSDECMFDWDCEQNTKKCCSNNCFKECVEPSLSAALRGKCPAPKEFAECHMGYRNLCSNDSECNYIVGGVCCFDGCRRRCATVDEFQDVLQTERLGRCPDLPGPEFCAADVNECEFDADCYPGRKCCRNTCFKRCLDPLHETGNMNVTQGAATGQCPTVSSSSQRCHIGLAHVCNNDNDCINSSCCFDGCRRKCLDPSGKSAGAQGELKKGTCPFLPPPQVCASDVDECFIDWDCVGDRKCCSNGCYKICAPPSKDRSAVGQVQAEAAVQCPEPVASSCTFSMKHACDYSSECFTGKICCFDGCRRRCVPPKGTSGVCPKPPETLECPVGLRNMCVDDASCVNGTLCCNDGCRRRCKDPSLCGGCAVVGKPRPGTCPSVLPPSEMCVTHYDECRYDWDCEGTTKKCCSNTCYNVCVEPAVGVVQDNCPAPTERLRCHIGLRAQCSSKSDCTHVSGGLCCFDGCRRRCATARGFEIRVETPRPGKCPILQPPELCVQDYDECEFDGDCYPGKKCCSNTCFTRCVNPTFGDVGSVSADPTTKCPITTSSKKCHVGYKNTCNNDDECETGTLCCFTGCRRLCWDPELRSSSRINKTGSCPALPPVTGPCASDVDECFMDSDCVKDKKCCSNGCFTICVPPAKTSITPAAAVKCPVPVPYPCTSSMRPSCEDQKDCSDDKVCCFDGCRPICVSPKGAPLRTSL